MRVGSVDIILTKINLPQFLQHQYEFFLPQVEKKGLELRKRYDIEDPDRLLLSDRYKLEGIMINLLNNALKFTREGYIEMGCKSGKNEVMFYVKDSGIGIPDDRREAVFESFVQSDLSRTRAYDGSGLGLSICQAYVTALGGKIYVESEKDKGSTFYFSIPVEPNKGVL